jgi:hypothetical protein
MGRVRPADVEDRREHGVRGNGVKQAGEIDGMHIRLAGSEERSPAGNRVCAGDHRRSHGPAVADAPRGHDRQLDRAPHLAEKLDEPRRALYVAACLHALCNDDVRTSLRSLDRSRDVTDLHEDYRATVVRSPYQLAIDAPGKRDEPRTFVEDHVEAIRLVEGQDEVHAIVDTDRRTDTLQLSAKHVRLSPRGGKRSKRTSTGHSTHEVGCRGRADWRLHDRHRPGNGHRASVVTLRCAMSLERYVELTGCGSDASDASRQDSCACR